MSGLRLEDRMGRRLELYEPTTFSGEKGAVLRSSFIDDAIVVHLDSNQAAILHAKLGEMLGANAEEKFADRVDRLEMAITGLREAVAKLAPQAALDALAEAFTAEMAKVKGLAMPAVAAVSRVRPTFSVFKDGKLLGRVTPLNPVIRIGSHFRSDIRVTSEALTHAVIEVGSPKSDSITAIDMGSGLSVNGLRWMKRELQIGDRIQIGSYEIVLEDIGKAALDNE